MMFTFQINTVHLLIVLKSSPGPAGFTVTLYEGTINSRYISLKVYTYTCIIVQQKSDALLNKTMCPSIVFACREKLFVMDGRMML